jgi:5-hydroxyisourate hydrolase
MGGRLTTHVLDTARGCPAAGVSIELWRLEADGTRTRLLTARTNADGRTDTPLLAGDTLTAGYYELVFAVGPYFTAHGLAAAVDTPPFLGSVPVRFGVADSAAHYHVPLLVSPWSYTTYRGS